MGSYGVIKEALLVKKNDSTGEYSIVQKLVTSTVNGMVKKAIDMDGDFAFGNQEFSLYSIYHGGSFGFSEPHKRCDVNVTVNIPGYGVKLFTGDSNIMHVNGVGDGIMCVPEYRNPTEPYTHLFLVVELPGAVFNVPTVG